MPPGDKLCRRLKEAITVDRITEVLPSLQLNSHKVSRIVLPNDWTTVSIFSLRGYDNSLVCSKLLVELQLHDFLSGNQFGTNVVSVPISDEQGS